MVLRKAGHIDSSIRGLQCNNTLKLCGITPFMLISKWGVASPCICWCVHVPDRVRRHALFLLQPPRRGWTWEAFLSLWISITCLASLLHKAAFSVTSPCLCFAHARGNAQHKRCIHIIYFILFYPPNHHIFTCLHLTESIIIHLCSYLGDISHITGIAIGPPSHVGTNQRCNIFTATAFHQESLKSLKSAWLQFPLLLGRHFLGSDWIVKEKLMTESKISSNKLPYTLDMATQQCCWWHWWGCRPSPKRTQWNI